LPSELTEDEILRRANKIRNARLKKVREDLLEQARREREHLKLKFKQDIEIIIPTDDGEISMEQLQRVIDAAKEYFEALDCLYEA
jgi:hypothetical protein